MDPLNGRRELYNDWIQDELDTIKFINSENKMFQSIREHYHADADLVVLCREIIWENDKLLQSLMERIADAKTRLKELGRLPG